MSITKADIIIIGGGAAGMTAAIGACRSIYGANTDEYIRSGAAGRRSRERKVIVLEKMPRPGRKIMITGKGRCNFTNVKEWGEFSKHVHPKANFLKQAFYSLKPTDLIEMLGDYGLRSIIERGDRAFPVSHRAMDVVDTLNYIARSQGAEILCNKEVCDITGSIQTDSTCKTDTGGMKAVNAAEPDIDGNSAGRTSGNGTFTVSCSDGSVYICNKLIITTGGLSYPTTGSSGDGHAWAKAFGHGIKECFPSLTAIVPYGYKDTTDCRKCPQNSMEPSGPESGEPTGRTESGETVPRKTSMKGHIDRNVPLTQLGRSLCGTGLKNVNISLVVNGNTVQEEFGDLDFTDGGLEGPIGFKISRNCVKALTNGTKVSVSVDLKPAVEQNTLAGRIETLWKEIAEDKRSRGKDYGYKMQILLGKVMPSDVIPAFVHFNPTVDHRILAERLKNWKMPIEGFVGYERCVITAGGISTDELTARTMESKLCAGLYFAGEILDMDADTGGYNLHIAFSTGYLAGMSAAKSFVTGLA